MKLFIDEETLPNEWYLDTICVAEKFRGKGVGSALLEALPKIASRDGYEVIGLSVDRANPHAKRLYEKHGFEVVAQREISGHLYDHSKKNQLIFQLVPFVVAQEDGLSCGADCTASNP